MATKKAQIITGRRKTSIARIRMQAGTGNISCNGTDFKAYFKRKSLAAAIVKPFEVTNRLGKYDITANLAGGGLTGQAGALRFAIAKALDLTAPELHTLLKTNGFLTRDSRIVQRKMYGHKKARKSFQFSKR